MTSEIIKCPDCGSTKCQQVTNNVYRCLYCGAQFKSESHETSIPPIYTAPQPQRPIYIQPRPYQSTIYTQPRMRARKEKSTAVLLALFLGWLGIQFFYLGNTVMGVLCVLFCWTGIPAFISVIHIIILLCTSQDDFDQKYNM